MFLFKKKNGLNQFQTALALTQKTVYCDVLTAVSELERIIS